MPELAGEARIAREARIATEARIARKARIRFVILLPKLSLEQFIQTVKG